VPPVVSVSVVAALPAVRAACIVAPSVLVVAAAAVAVAPAAGVVAAAASVHCAHDGSVRLRRNPVSVAPLFAPA